MCRALLVSDISFSFDCAFVKQLFVMLSSHNSQEQLNIIEEEEVEGGTEMQEAKELVRP